MVGFLSGDSEWVCSYRVGFIPALKHEAFALTFRKLPTAAVVPEEFGE